MTNYQWDPPNSNSNFSNICNLSNISNPSNPLESYEIPVIPLSQIVNQNISNPNTAITNNYNHNLMKNLMHQNMDYMLDLVVILLHHMMQNLVHQNINYIIYLVMILLHHIMRNWMHQNINYMRYLVMILLHHIMRNLVDQNINYIVHLLVGIRICWICLGHLRYSTRYIFIFAIAALEGMVKTLSHILHYNIYSYGF